MQKRLLTLLAVLLPVLTLAAAPHHGRGAGCWRTATARRQAAARMATAVPLTRGATTPYQGQKRGLVILAEFTDRKFKDAHDREKYDHILNTPGYTTAEGFRGSVADYFRDQSGGLFNLGFDVVGPYVTQYGYKYYGQNDSKGDDLHPDRLIVEMCQAADGEVDFSDYDWDGDGEVDEVFVIYAGKGESDTGNEDLLWPHMWTLREATDTLLTLDGTAINIYACSNELSANGRIEGIGTFCHEFSHCLGLPDFYDISYSGHFGMGDFDVMASGCYAGGGFTPVGFTAYEKMACGWQQPIVLSTADVTVDGLRPVSEQGDTYIIYNEACPDEYYLIENRQLTGWDRNYPARGLMVTHVDYDAEVWFNNIPNSLLTQREALDLGLTCGNDHERMAIVHADNDDDSRYWNAMVGYYTRTTLSTDLYPYHTRDSLTATSTPALTLYHDNSDGRRLLKGALLNISDHGDGTMSFSYRAGENGVSSSVSDEELRAEGGCGIYDLQGRRVTQAAKGGIYIVRPDAAARHDRRAAKMTVR